MVLTPGGRVGDATPLGKGKRKLSDYEREVAHALMRHGKSKRDAIRIARGVIDRAAATGRWGRGKAKPNVRAGAVASVAQRATFHAHQRVDVELGKNGATWHHGWIPTNAIARTEKSRRSKSKPRSKVKPPNAAEKAKRRQAAVWRAQREMARRAIVVSRLNKGALKPVGRRYVSDGEGKFRVPSGTLTGGRLTSFANTVDLGKDGSKWKHGYIPENAIAEEMKEHRFTGFKTADVGQHKSAEIHGIAQSVLDRARSVEPKVTHDLRHGVESRGGRMDSLMDSPNDPGDFRFKSHESLVRKLRDKSAQKGITPEEYAPKIADALRYTAVFNPDTMVEDSQKLFDHLQSQGHTVSSVENTFHHGQVYSGVNANMVAPNGVPYELQIHTPQSIAIKNKIHHDYEIVRDPNASLAERKLAYNRMFALNTLLQRPAGFEKLGEQIHRTDPQLHDNAQIRALRREAKRQRDIQP